MLILPVLCGSANLIVVLWFVKQLAILKSLMLRCTQCGRYTLADVCPNCGGKTVTAHPARYSPDDKYARYRSPLAYQTTDQGTS